MPLAFQSKRKPRPFSATKRLFQPVWFASITPIGAAHVDGRFIGLGGGQVFGLGAGEWGSTRFHLTAGGALAWGYEELGWKEFDTKNMSTLHCQDVGLAGVFLPPYGRPGPVPS